MVEIWGVDYTLPVIGGTKTHTLMVSIKPTFSGGVVKGLHWDPNI